MNKIKIAIIGAGPSGFGAAEAFRSKEFAGRFEITIYEKNDYVGGKCCTVDEKGNVTNGQPGGYEMGATIIAKHTSNYKALSAMIDAQGTELKPFIEKDRHMFRYMKRGKFISIKQIYLAQLFHQPRKFFQALRGYDAYTSDYMKYVIRRTDGYANQSKALYKSVSKKYGKPVYTRLAGIMQGFGYADMDDKHLTPPALYYHQYIEPSIFAFPTYIVKGGTQGIWAKLADSYPANSVCLNETVAHIERHQDLVRIRTNKRIEDYDYVVVATPLKPALSFLDTTPEEHEFMSKMKHNHYVSVLCQTSDLGSVGLFNLPAMITKRKIGEVMFAYQRYSDSNYVVAYLYVKPGAKLSDNSIIDSVERDLKKSLRVSIINKEQAKVFHWQDYFGHLDTKTLKSGWYEEFDRHYQGQQRTLYVSSGLHMETVGASFQYGNSMGKKYARKWLEQPI